MAEGLFEELPMIETTIRNGDKLSTMRIKCEIEVPDLETARAVGARRSKIIDGFVAHIDTLRITDLQGPDNLHRLRALFTEIANAAVAPLRVDGVLFKEMLVK